MNPVMSMHTPSCRGSTGAAARYSDKKSASFLLVGAKHLTLGRKLLGAVAVLRMD